MYAITGITGHVGGAAARNLLAEGAPVRAVVRDPGRGTAWEEQGAELAVADLTDRTALTTALTGCDGAFLMLPTVATFTAAEHEAMAGTIAAAAIDSGVPHVALLSSVGAQHAAGTGPVRWLHRLENRLRGAVPVLTAIRSAHFQEKVEEVLGAVGAGLYPVLGDADAPLPMVATRDVGAAVAAALGTPPPGDEIVDLVPPSWTERQVAELLGGLLGRTLEVVAVPRDGWLAALRDDGVPPALAAELVELADAGRRGLLRPEGADRQVRCVTRLGDTLAGIVAAEPARP